MTSEKQPRHLIIGGAAKAGTTSVFMYLQGHPQVCTSTVKETNYFLSLQYKILVSRPYSFWMNDPPTIASYYDLFPCLERPILCEGSPSYLISDGTAQVIADHLQNVKLIFIVREPVERFYSHYLQYRKAHLIPAKMSFEDFYRLQARSVDVPEFDLTRRALSTGCYSAWLAAYYAVFPTSDILVLPFRMLKYTPRLLMQEICRFAAIDEDYYDKYNFEIFNQTRVYRAKQVDAVYKTAMKRLNLAVAYYPKLSRMLHTVNRRTMMRWYQAFNTTQKLQEGIPPDIRAELETFYAGEAERLAELTGQRGLLDT